MNMELVAKAKSENKYKFSQYLRTRNVLSVSFNPKDSSKLYYIDNTRGKFDLWRQNMPGSYPIQLTHSTEWSVNGFGLSENGEHILLSAMYQGNEKHQLFLIPEQGGAPKRITPDKEKLYFPAYGGQLGEKRLVMTTNHHGPTMDVCVLNLETQEVEQLTASDRNMAADAVSPDKKKIAITEAISNTIQKIYLFDMEDKKLEILTPDEGEVSYQFAQWKNDSSGFYMRTNKNRDYHGIADYDLATRKWEYILKPDWNVGGYSVSKDGKWATWVTNENGYGKMSLKNLTQNKLIDLDAGQQGVAVVEGFSKDSKYLCYGYTDSTKVRDIHVLNLENMEEKVLTKNMLGGIDPEDMIRPELVSFKNEHGMEIPAFLYRPKGANESTPIVLSIHGGPEAQERPVYNYNGYYQILLSLGIGILAPNIRGSTGYTKEYQKMIHRKWADISYDIEACMKYLRSLNWVQKDNIGIFGGSFGGYATLFAIAKMAHLNWKFAVDICGPSNLITFVASVPDFWKPVMKSWIGDAVEDEEMLKENSPINFIENINTNLMIAQGSNDPRVVQAESDQIVEKLKKRGVNVTYEVYEDEGHGFVKNENRDDFFKKSVEFIYKSVFDKEIDLSSDDL